MKKQLDLFIPGELACLYPGIDVYTPKERLVDLQKVGFVRVAGVAEDKLLLADGRIFVLSETHSNTNPLGAYMVCHWDDPKKEPDYIAFPDLDSLAERVEHQFLADYIGKAAQKTGFFETLSLRVLRKIYGLLPSKSHSKRAPAAETAVPEPLPDNIGDISEDGVITRAFYGQGMVFKSWKNYYGEDDTLPVYVPELSDTVYTKNFLLKLCSGQKDFADELFDALDWQHPESVMEDWFCNDEWQKCPDCGKLSSCYSDDGARIGVCPHCGHSYEE